MRNAPATLSARSSTTSPATVAFIVEVNADRRHWSTGQRAMAVAIGLVENGQRANGRFKRGTVPGDKRGSSHTGWRKAMEQAGVVLDHAPDLADPG